MIPHITDELKARVLAMAEPDADGEVPDVVITEIGGTVGDIESLPFIEAARQVRHDVGRDNVFFLHVSLVPYLAPSGELKTKPTQHLVAALRNVGIQPDALILRWYRDVPEGLKKKIALMCDVELDGVISTPDAPSIYDIPKVLHNEHLDAYVVRKLGLPFRDVDWTVWGELLRRVHEPRETVRVALVGKYVDLPDAYLSVTEAIRAGGFAWKARTEIKWVPSDDCATEAGAQAALGDVDAILVPGGFGIRGIEGKLGAISYARRRGIPLLGLCLGLQCVVIEAALVGGSRGRELDRVRSRHPVPGHLDDGRSGGCGCRRGRPGRHHAPGRLRRGPPARFGGGGGLWHPRGVRASPSPLRGEQRLSRQDFRVRARISGTSPDGHLVEFVEYPKSVHPFFVATQAHPELKSRPTRPHPLFRAFIEAALKYKAAERLPVDLGEDYESNDAPAEAVAAINEVKVEPVAGIDEAASGADRG